MIKDLVNKVNEIKAECEKLEYQKIQVEKKLAKLLKISESRVLMPDLISVSEKLPDMTGTKLTDDDGKPFVFWQCFIDGIKIMYTEDCE